MVSEADLDGHSIFGGPDASAQASADGPVASARAPVHKYGARTEEVVQNCRLREAPTRKAATIGHVRKGDRYETAERRGGWRRVSVRGKDGWVGPACWKK